MKKATLPCVWITDLHVIPMVEKNMKRDIDFVRIAINFLLMKKNRSSGFGTGTPKDIMSPKDMGFDDSIFKSINGCDITQEDLDDYGRYLDFMTKKIISGEAPSASETQKYLKFVIEYFSNDDLKFMLSVINRKDPVVESILKTRKDDACKKQMEMIQKEKERIAKASEEALKAAEALQARPVPPDQPVQETPPSPQTSSP